MDRRSAFGAAAMLLLAQGLLAADCTDGVTPDCSDAAAQCGTTTLDAAQDVSQIVPEASTNDTGTPQDAGDEG
jgi:hypothetical protein